MADSIVVLLAAAVGALAGIGGSAVGALASLRASQLAARVPLAEKIHVLNQTIVHLHAAAGGADYVERLKAFQVAWNDLIVHQKILVPSRRLQLLHEIVRDAALDPALRPLEFPALAGEALNASTDIVAAYSSHMFRWWARIDERSIARRFRQLAQSKLRSPALQRLSSEL
jgi:hypothetical protein